MSRVELRIYAAVALVAIALSPAAIRWSLPNSAWLTVRGMAIGDTRAGQPVIVSVDRTIHRPFRARWIVTVRRVSPEGLLTHCIGRGENDYSPAATLPRPMTLKYWSNVECEMPVGQYRVDTLWTIEDWAGDREVRVMSNVFRVE